jgi:hypothetical protein
MRRRVVVPAMVFVGVAAALMGVLAGSAGAVHEVVIEYTVIRGAPGEVVEIANEEVEPWLQGESCAIEVETDNNQSVHPGTDILIVSGADSVTVSDVESESGLVTVAAGELVFGETVVASIRLGPDGIASGGVRTDFLCDQLLPTTTTEAIVSPTSSTPPPTSTTVPPTVPVAPAPPPVAVEGEPSFTG